MNKVSKVAIGVFAIGVIGYFSLQQHMKNEIAADTEACKTLQPAIAADAVIADVLRPDNSIFGKYHLARKDVSVDMSGVQIGPTIAMIPFTVSAVPGLPYSGMPRCSDLTDIEYGN
ncbi:hypothetical protein RM150_22730 (plasmid) [Pantoea agglomerans]|uniref:hypothetical protein n=1 Tax=Enterobacter agglomerans TaxID=549 RepID=UPI0028A02F4B|nr:hypothetical protein [Pantoea agglomerans]WNK46979.1 hypothetical protein RM150_22730 [Pantoea agglomerans]